MRSVFLLALAACTNQPATMANDRVAYTIDHLYVPANNTQARAYGFDLDGDGVTDNQLGQVLGVGASLGIDTAGVTERSIASGMLSVGIDLDAEGTAPGPISIALAVVDPKLIVPIDLVDPRVELDAVDDTTASGVIGGGLTAENLRDDLYPMLAAGFTELVARDCDSGCHCTASTTGAMLAEALGCPITSDEVAASSSISGLLAPDVTIANHKLLSFGVGFTATRRN